MSALHLVRSAGSLPPAAPSIPMTSRKDSQGTAARGTWTADEAGTAAGSASWTGFPGPSIIQTCFRTSFRAWESANRGSGQVEAWNSTSWQDRENWAAGKGSQSGKPRLQGLGFSRGTLAGLVLHRLMDGSNGIGRGRGGGRGREGRSKDKRGSFRKGGRRCLQGVSGGGLTAQASLDMSLGSGFSAASHGAALAAITLGFPPFSLPIDAAILRASIGASLKLFTLCTFVVWLQKSGRLPESTPSVLSQVAFRICIPCFLMSKVALTLTTQPVGNFLALPFVAFSQVLLGALLGKVACRLAYHRPPLVKSRDAGRPTKAATEVAASVVAGIGLSSSLSDKEANRGAHLAVAAPRGVGALPRATSKKEAVVTAACGFGNSLTLPLVFIAGVLSTVEVDRAAGYLALYMTGWSPTLWSIGYNIIASGDDSDVDNGDGSDSNVWEGLVAFIQRVMNPPLYGVLFGLLIGATPLAHLFLPLRPAVLPMDTVLAPWEVLSRLTAGVLKPALEAASLLGSATLGVQTIVLATSLAGSVPSNLGISLGALYGRRNAVRELNPSSSSPKTSPLGGAPRIGTLQDNDLERGSGTIQTDQERVLKRTPMADSGIAPRSPLVGELDESTNGRQGMGTSGALVRTGGSTESSGGLEDAPCGTSLLDGRALWVVSAVRFLALPLANIALVLALRRFHIVPSDPVLAFLLMLEGAMPPAQNLVLLSQLKPGTRPLAGELAALMLRLYALSIIPITLWIAVFLSLVTL